MDKELNKIQEYCVFDLVWAFLIIKEEHIKEAAKIYLRNKSIWNVLKDDLVNDEIIFSIKVPFFISDYVLDCPDFEKHYFVGNYRKNLTEEIEKENFKSEYGNADDYYENKGRDYEDVLIMGLSIWRNGESYILLQKGDDFFGTRHKCPNDLSKFWELK